MSTSLTHETTYDAPLARVSAMLTDPAFRRAVFESQDATSVEVTITGTTESGTVTIDYTQPTAGVPSFAKKLVGDGVRIVQREQWTGDKADLHVSIPGRPGEMTGTIALTAAGGTTRETVDCEISVHMPLVGGKIERLIQEMLLKALRNEGRVGREWLAG
jgi:uncharacterized protein YndB with AHSA1/START domain